MMSGKRIFLFLNLMTTDLFRQEKGTKDAKTVAIFDDDDQIPDERDADCDFYKTLLE